MAEFFGILVLIGMFVAIFKTLWNLINYDEGGWFYPLYLARWYRTHAFCDICGQPMVWDVDDSVVRYEALTGEGYFVSRYVCPDHGAVHKMNYGVTPTRKEYL